MCGCSLAPAISLLPQILYEAKMSGFGAKLTAFVMLLFMSGAVAQDSSIAPLPAMLAGAGFALLVPCVLVCCAVLLSLVHGAFQLT